MKLTLNGREHDTAAANVRELLSELEMDRPGVAVELNQQVVPRKAYDATPLTQGDRVEVVSLVGGG